jgi:nicotinamide riboside kinase
MSDIVEAVAKAIAQKQLDEGDRLYDWYALTDEVADGYRDMARAAIEAYEAAKREKAHAAFGDVDKAVTEASAAIPGLMRGLAR